MLSVWLLVGFILFVLILLVSSLLALYLVLVATIAAFVGQDVVRRVVNILGRASIIIFILDSTIFISAISLMPKTYVVHLGNSNELMEVAEDRVVKRILREHVREALGVRNEDILFAHINSVSRGKGQDLFLHAFDESLRLIQEQKLQVPSIHAVIVGSDMTVQTKFETELRKFVLSKKIQHRVHFVNKTLTVAPYLAAVNVIVQNSQGRGECFGRISIEAMAFQLPVLLCQGTAARGTT